MKVTKSDYLKPIPIDANCPDGDLSMQIATSTTNGQPSPDELCLLLEMGDGPTIPILFDKAQVATLIRQLQRVERIM